MSYMNRVYMAAGVVVVKGHSDQGQKLKSLNHAKKQFFSGHNGPEAADFRPLSGVVNSGVGSSIACGGERGHQTEESLRHAMYFNCWGQG